MSIRVVWHHAYWVPQIRSVTQSCPTLCDPMNRSTPGLPVHHQLPEFTETHVHWISDAIQPSHLLSSPSPLAPNPSQHQSLFQWVNSSHECLLCCKYVWLKDVLNFELNLIYFPIISIKLFHVQSSFKLMKLRHHSSVQLSLSLVLLFATPWIAARQASLSITNCRSSLKLTSIVYPQASSCSMNHYMVFSHVPVLSVGGDGFPIPLSSSLTEEKGQQRSSHTCQNDCHQKHK